MSSNGIPDDLAAALDGLAALPRVVVASDYDGCMAPIVSNPQDAVPNPASAAAIERLAAAPNTLAAVVSGRALADLRVLSGLSAAVTLVGSHGSEFADGFTVPITSDDSARLGRIVDEFHSLAKRFDGVTVEVKPASTTLHVRNAAPDDAKVALAAARSGPASWPGVYATEGKAVIELAVIETSKGIALDTLRGQFDAEAVVYLGDDVTDEKAFAHLRHGRDVSIKVGEGETGAEYRIAGTDHVATVLETLARLRRN
ncbi:trehalose-phosphatase [Gordonia effusa NBRC 100432]|uniref:Trehalose 6-phosphate phosphatase n=1 Tax=Gordonia effusa NBRC 100432 TaxID=1077974 RepID=H0QXC6_9ACTN|nr:trehalose-phosphatase [Gordonia effusa]GAB17477.1 trehalose-phosphatase [Gordonia effusa NBRC 100432]